MGRNKSLGTSGPQGQGLCVFCTWVHHVTAEQMLYGNNISIAVQRDNQAETFNNKQDKRILKSNEPSFQSPSKSDSNILMAFPLSNFCCCFLFKKIKPSLNSVLLPSYYCWGPTLLVKFSKTHTWPCVMYHPLASLTNQQIICWISHS